MTVENDILVDQDEPGGYTVVPKRITEDTSLSAHARLLLIYLLGKPHHWRVLIPDVMRQLGVGRNKAYEVVNELITTGYIERREVRDEAGQYVRHDLIVRSRPTPLPQSREVDPLPGSPHPGFGEQSNYREEAITESPPHARGGEGRTHPKTGRRLAETAHPLPEGWEPSAETVAKLTKRYPAFPDDLANELEDFTEHFTVGKQAGAKRSNWDVEFGTWVRRTYRWGSPRGKVKHLPGREPVRQPAASAAERSEQRAAAARELLAEFARDDVLLEPHPKANGRAGS